MVFKENENEKKRKYQQRVLDVETGTSPPLFSGQMVEWELMSNVSIFDAIGRKIRRNGSRTICRSRHEVVIA